MVLKAGGVNREKLLKVVLVGVGLLFTALTYFVVMFLWQEKRMDAEPMMLSIYATLGIFLLVAARNPLANRSLIAFTAWSSIAHATVMTVQAFQASDVGDRTHLLMGVGFFGVAGLVLLLLLPGGLFGGRTSVTGA
jgi:hypothetical protein